MKPRKGYNGWKLLNRDELVTSEGYQYSKLIAHHVTYKFGVTEDDPLPLSGSYAIVGYADSGDGLEAFVVAIDGSTERPDGSIYHITWSLDSNYSPKDSNILVQEGYEAIGPIPIELEPMFFPFQ